MRINDRGPFLHDRVIDLSYAAAASLGIAQKGSGEVVVEAILPAELLNLCSRRAVAAGGRGATRARSGRLAVGRAVLCPS